MRHAVNLVVVMCMLLQVFSAPAAAHDLKMSAVRIRLEKANVSVSVRAHLHSLKTNDPANELKQRLKLRLDGRAFVPDKVHIIEDKANGIFIWQAQRKAPAVQAVLDAPLFPEEKTESTVVTVLSGGRVVSEALLKAQDAGGSSVNDASTGGVALRFLREGVVHIFLGFDHILFLLSLLLLGGSWKKLLKIVTAFSLAHSITLSLAATGIFVLPSRFVEPVIA
ncbi:MAG TPA: HupE/UreJ family protein, partial [Abditibacteriaceae bacterium]